MDPVLLEGWRDYAAVARKQQEQSQERLCYGLATEKRSAWWDAVLATIAVVGCVLLAVFVPLQGERLFSSLSMAAAWLVSRYGLAIVGVLVACFFLARRNSSVRRIRDYENTLAFMSEMHVMVSAAITLNRGAAIDRSIEALVAAQKHGLLSAASIEHAAGTRRRLGVVARLLRVFMK
jgi:hypothetical protein